MRISANHQNLIKEMFLPGVKKYGIKLEKADFNKLKIIYKKEKVYIWIKEKNKSYVCHLKEIVLNKSDKKLTHIGYRQFFTKIGLKGVGSWENLSKDEKILDKRKRDLTKDKLKH